MKETVISRSDLADFFPIKEVDLPVNRSSILLTSTFVCLTFEFVSMSSNQNWDLDFEKK